MPIKADDLSRWALPNPPENTDYVPENEEPQIPIEGINITDVEEEFFEEIRESYKQDMNCHILTFLLEKDFKDSDLVNSLDEIWKTSYDDIIFHLFDVILSHRSEHTCAMVLFSRMLINQILLECHEKIYSGNISEEKEMEINKTGACWLSWRKDVIEYCHSCDRCQKAKKATGKRFGLMIHIQEPINPLEVVHMGWETNLPPAVEKS
ncbi:hypothetical protein O181_038562 [Austropuccinia psidii MF-1]|uniref:Integrase zinc-binding domain-containing protein n=1 Tax=Austropuccinia psidii MF-1 TaxID=1389203 RepID=A0A9Q3DB66_9BASI|nr:hypothetical protein [Austropuccinia psidii MF-1]